MTWTALLAVLATVTAVQPPREIEALQKQVLQLLGSNKAADAIPLLDKALLKYPNSPEVHELLGSSHSVVAESLEGDEAQAPKRRTHLQHAAQHFARTLELTHVNRAANLSSLAEIYLPPGLNDPREAERFSRRLMEDHPSLRSGYAALARALIAGGRGRDAAAVLASTHKALDAEAQVAVVADALQDVQRPEARRREVLAPVLAEALRITNETIRSRPEDGRVLMVKSMILDLQANAVEEKAERRAALLADSKSLWEKGRALNAAGRPSIPEAARSDVPEPPPAPKVPQAAETAHRRGVQLWSAVNEKPGMPAGEARKTLQQALAAFDEALQFYPEYMEALVFKSLVLRTQGTKYEPDPARARALVAEADRLRQQAMEMQKRRR